MRRTLLFASASCAAALSVLPDYEWFCKHDADANSYYVNCDDTCETAPICCDLNDADPTSASGSGGYRCTESEYGVTDTKNCDASAYPSACPTDYQWFCKHDADANSYYSNCDICEGDPICCDVDEVSLPALGHRARTPGVVASCA